MLRTRVTFTGSALKVVCQVGASVATTLIASMIFAALPKATVPADRPAAELTSGGKFAARIPGAEMEARGGAERAAALPILAEAPAQAIALSAANAAWDEAGKPVQPAALGEPVRPRLHLPARGDVRRSSDAGAGEAKRSAGLVAVALPSGPATSASVDIAPTRAEDGVLPRVAASVRSLWSITSSAGGSLLSRIVP